MRQFVGFRCTYNKDDLSESSEIVSSWEDLSIPISDITVTRHNFIWWAV